MFHRGLFGLGWRRPGRIYGFGVLWVIIDHLSGTLTWLFDKELCLELFAITVPTIPPVHLALFILPELSHSLSEKIHFF